MDSENQRIQVFYSHGDLLHQWGTLGNLPGQFYDPDGIAVDSENSVYVVDTSNHRVQKFTRQGTWLASLGSKGYGDGQFFYPVDIAIARGRGEGGKDALYVTDCDNHRVQVWSSDGTYERSWGSRGSGAGQFQGPAGIALDRSGYIYVADRHNHRVQKFDADGNFILAWGSKGGRGRSVSRAARCCY
ncbi:MAG: 6-bladed beta-propeller [Chloroflexaceae bacterium]|nr:6-bladed beta-propeller [Chloroflexaceae bacterium]